MGDVFALAEPARASAVERVGRVGTLVDEAVDEAALALQPLRDDMAAAVRKARSKQAAQAGITRAIRKHADSEQIANAIFMPAALGDMAGQLMVHAYEQPHGRESRQLSLGEGQDVRAFLAMGWEEARQYFEERGLVKPRELERLLRERARLSEEARDLLLQRVQERTYELLEQAIGEGTSYGEFAQQLSEDATGLGITTADPAYLQTVFRTNVLDAYGAGRARAMSNPVVVAARPYRQIRTAGDGRVRETHAAADGMVFMADGPIGNLRPPFSYNCRCSVVTLSSYEGDVIETVPGGLLDDGFGGL